MLYRDANRIQKFVRRSAAMPLLSWFYARVLHHLDRLTSRLTRGRHTVTSRLSGLPVVMLTTIGAKSGQERSSPVLAVSDGDKLVVVASNWGQAHHPAWYHNLRAHPTALVTVGGVSRLVRAHEATGAERERLWLSDLEFYPTRAAYARRAANRRIPVLVLSPVDDGS